MQNIIKVPALRNCSCKLRTVQESIRRVGQSNQIIEREYRLEKQIEWLTLLACLLLCLLLLCSNTLAQCKLHGEISRHLPCSWEHIILFYLYSDKSVITDGTSFHFNHLKTNSWINLIKIWSPVHGVDSWTDCFWLFHLEIKAFSFILWQD